MEAKKEFKILGWIAVVFVFAYFMPLENARFSEAIFAMFDLAKWYAQEHVILCLLPAFFYRWGHCCFCKPGCGDEIFWS